MEQIAAIGCMIDSDMMNHVLLELCAPQARTRNISIASAGLAHWVEQLPAFAGHDEGAYRALCAPGGIENYLTSLEGGQV